MPERIGLRLYGGVETLEHFPELEELAYGWVTRYEPELAPQGEQWIETSDDPAQALVFPDVQSAFECFRQSIGARWDGRPNRPITIFHVGVEPLPQQGGNQ